MDAANLSKDELLKRYLDGVITMEEAAVLFDWIKENQDGEFVDVEQVLKDYYQQAFAEEATMPASVAKDHLDKLLKSINKNDTPAEITSVRRMHTKWWAAAAIFLLLGTGAYFFLANTNQRPAAKVATGIQKDVDAPKTNKAVLTLSDGDVIVLDSAANGSLAMQGNVKVIKTATGQIAYKGSATAVKYNTLTVPKGSKPVQLLLSDGSLVWLNVASSITYPTAFTGAERKVNITGEAYFEVAHNAALPFVVENDKVSIQVLGTHFNVNAYEDEGVVKVTLLEGSVKVSLSKEGEGVKIKPGQQAQVQIGQSVKVLDNVDLGYVLAWQKGMFEFSNTDLATIMRQISRWYDVKIAYERTPGNAKFGGGISKNLPLSAVLRLLEANGVQFKLEGKVLKVIP